jgi:hypothetical protein
MELAKLSEIGSALNNLRIIRIVAIAEVSFLACSQLVTIKIVDD